MNTANQRISYDNLRDQLKLKNLQIRQGLARKHEHLSQELTNRAFDIEHLRQKSAHILSTTALASAFLLAHPTDFKALPPPEEIIEKAKAGHSDPQTFISPQKVLIDSLHQMLPEKPRPLTQSEEKNLEQVFSQTLNVPAKGTLEGEHLNQTYGYIGAEQHLRRFPGDSMDTHLDTDADKTLFKEGMAPGLGAWGYFAKSKSDMTPELKETEKWYAVVQTLYLPDWNTRTKYLREWYKYRKVLIVNTDNGNAVVAAIADSGPAAWTGKHFGGSPEVMTHLGGPRYKKGPVVLFFVDDPENKVPLGPVDYNKIDLPEWSFHQI
jgi:hypothetical protein